MPGEGYWFYWEENERDNGSRLEMPHRSIGRDVEAGW